MAEITYLEAIREALFEEMERDVNVMCLGEDIGAYGGAFKVTDGLLDKFGETRVIDSPISEIAIVGAAAGAATHHRRTQHLRPAQAVLHRTAGASRGSGTRAARRPSRARGWPLP